METTEYLDLFSLLNVLAFYTGGQKRLYIWVGENASRTLKNYIVRFRQVFTDDYPDYRVLRYITIESMTEPFEFFQNTGISKEELHAKLKAEEAKYKEHEAIISQISNLKNDADTAFENEKYDEAIDIANKIVELARSINDESIIKDQNDFIAEAEARGKAKAVLKDIRNGKKELNHRFKNFKNDDELVEIYNESKDFEQKYNDYLDLPALSDVKNLLENIEIAYNDLQTPTEDPIIAEELERAEETKFFESTLEEINRLRQSGKDTLGEGNLIGSYDKFKDILNLIKKHCN